MLQKAKVLTLILFGLLFLNLSAQESEFANDPTAKLPDEDRKVRFGLQFSPNISWLKANSAGYKSDGTKVGFSYGLSVEFFLTNNYLFSTGVNILNVGGELSYTGWGTTTTRSLGGGTAKIDEQFNIKYIETPLILKLRTNEIGYLTYFGQFGFNVGINFKANADYTYEYTDVAEMFIPDDLTEARDDITDEINFLNISLVIGAGVEYNISGNTSLMLGITYNNGFINQLDKETYVINEFGYVARKESGVPITSEKSASANLNYIALNIGIYF